MSYKRIWHIIREWAWEPPTNGISVGKLAQADETNMLVLVDSNMKADNKAQFSDNSYQSKELDENRTFGSNHRGLGYNNRISQRDSSSSCILRRIRGVAPNGCLITAVEVLI